jgi:hypothetical protein
MKKFTERLPLMLSPEQRSRVEATATEHGMSVAEWIRALIDRELARAARAERGLSPGPKPPSGGRDGD